MEASTTACPEHKENEMPEAHATGVLLKSGVVLIHDAQNRVVPIKTDILIENGNIARIGAHIEAIDGAEVIDCTDKIISPGFVDTHHHGWQTQLKGRHANEQLLEYMATGEHQIKNITMRLTKCLRQSAVVPILARGCLLWTTCWHAGGNRSRHNYRG